MKRYTDNEKQHALRRLKNNRGDVPLTSLQTRISERTLYDWKRKLRLQEDLDRNLQHKKNTAAAATAANLHIESMLDNTVEILGHESNTHSEDNDEEVEHEYVRFRDNLIRHIIHCYKPCPMTPTLLIVVPLLSHAC
ncbi:MAG: hypothetical protein Q9P01_22545 [Anaerolineae bacterium]|nr:hypothetical protein [Anaerolineae bacterium]